MNTLNDTLEVVNPMSDEADLRRLNRYVIARLKQVRSLQAMSIKGSLREDQLVSFTAGLSQGRGRKRKETVVSGRITSVKQKYAHVRVTGIGAGHYRVPMSSLTIMEE